MPTRIQRKRTKGSKLPLKTVYIGRPSKWGNHFRVEKSLSDYKRNQNDCWRVYDDDGWAVNLNRGQFLQTKSQAAKFACDLFIEQLRKLQVENPAEFDAKYLAPLRHADYIACWCNVDEPCHADVWLELLKEIK